MNPNKVNMNMIALPYRACILSAMLAATIALPAQNYSDQAKNYFTKTLNSGQFTVLCIKSLPTMDDCKLVFKGQNAYTFYGFSTDLKSEFREKSEQPSETFADIKVESFTTEDVLSDKGNYAGGMRRLKEKLQPNVTFYEINMLRTMGAEHGVAYKYWVNINGRWAFFPKPWSAFDR